MGGQDGYADSSRQFNMTSFSSDSRAESAFVKKLENELGYQNLTDKNGKGTDERWTQAKADKNIDILSYGLKQLNAQGLVNDGRLTTQEVNRLDLGEFLNSPVKNTPKETGSNPVSTSPTPATPAPTSGRDVNNVPAPQTPSRPVQSTGGGDYGSRPMDSGVKIHTLNASVVRPQFFDKNTRWYNESGNTQSFRLYEGEVNQRNSRPNSARIEAFTDLDYKKGEWHEWSGEYTIINPQKGAIFQAKNNKNDWGVQINMTQEGDIWLNRREGKDITLAKDMTGKSFDLKVRDNGDQYEVYYNGKLAGTGRFDRPEGTNNFRWGMYVGAKRPSSDGEIEVRGAQWGPSKS